MATTAAKVRFVRCPKCRKLLTEFADVPVYQCGGCGTILQAKTRNAAGEKSSQCQSDNVLSDNGSTYSDENIISSSEHRLEPTISRKASSTSSNIENNYHGNGESSDRGSNGIEGSCSNAAGKTSQESNPPQHLADNGLSDNGSSYSDENIMSSSVRGRELAISRNASFTSSNFENNYDEKGESSNTGSNDIEGGSSSNAAREKSHDINPSQCLSGNGLSDNGSTYSDENIVSSSSDCGREHTISRNASSTSSNIDNNDHEKGESSGTGSYAIEGRSSCNANHLAFIRNEDENIQTKTGSSSNKEEKSLNSSEQGCDSVSSNDIVEQAPESLLHRFNFPSKEEMVDRAYGRRRSSSLRSKAASFSDEKSTDRIREKYSLMSKRTFRNQSVSRSTETKGKQEQEEDRTFRSISTSSQDFHSVLSWMGSEEDRLSRSSSKDSTFHDNLAIRQNASTSAKLKNLNQDRLVLLRMVEELRNQLSGDLSDLRKEEKQISQPLFFNHDPRAYHWSSQMPPSYLQYHCEPDFSCNNNPYRSSTNTCCHSSEGRSSLELDSGTGLPPFCPKARRTKRPFRPVSGGAPFVICSKCSELLQLPEDFLIAMTGSSKLRCGACSEVLLLSLPRQRNAVSQTTYPVENSSAEPADEYGTSAGEGSSLEAEHVLNVSRNSFEEGGGDQSVTSPLHQLMGYPSARELLH